MGAGEPCSNPNAPGERHPAHPLLLSFGRGCSWVPSERLDRQFFLSGFLPSPLLVFSELCCLLAFSTFFPYLIFFPAAAARAAAACMLVTVGYVVPSCGCPGTWCPNTLLEGVLSTSTMYCRPPAVDAGPAIWQLSPAAGVWREQALALHPAVLPGTICLRFCGWHSQSHCLHWMVPV